MKKSIVSNVVIVAALSMAVSNVIAEGNHKGGHGHEGKHWASPKEAAARKNPIKSDQDSLNRGKKVYMASCINCHGKSAKGDGPLASGLIPKPTNLTMMAGMHSDGDFEWKIANGRGSMPAWKNFLKENQRWDVVNYIQSLENPNKGMDHSKMDHSKMDHSKMSKEEMLKMDHSNMTEEEMAGMDHSGMTKEELKSMGIKPSSHSQMDHSKMDHSKMDHSKMSKEEMLKMDHSNMTEEEMTGMDHSNMTEEELESMGIKPSSRSDKHKDHKHKH